MASNIKQHFVPQSYLRRFTLDGKLLFVFDKLSKEIRKANVRDIAEERYFNRIPTEAIPQEMADQDFDVDIFEKRLSRIESGYNAEVDRIIRATATRGFCRRVLDAFHITRRRCMSRKQKAAMSFFIALQYIRTREFRDTMVDASEKLKEALKKHVPEEMQDKFFGTSPVSDKVRTSVQHLDLMLDTDVLEDFSQRLYNHIWVVGLNHTAKTFYTSDHPVVRLPHKKHPFLGNAGLGSPGIEIALPLGSRHILIMWERRAFKAFTKFERKWIRLEEENVTCYNSLQVLQSHRQVYCVQDDFSVAQEACRRWPERCSQDRERVKVD